MCQQQEHDFYKADGRINFERIRKICRESDFARENEITERDGRYISNFDFRLNVDQKKKLGAEDILDEEIILAYLAPRYLPGSVQPIPGNVSGGFMITKFGIFSASFIHDDGPFGVYVPFEDLARANTIDEGFPEYIQYSVVRGWYDGTYHWIMADETQIAFFAYCSAYGNRPLINLFREIASSVRRDLGIGRVNILQDAQDE